MPEIGSKPEADIDLVDETFEASHSESYHLSIQTEPGRLTFCVFNTVIHKYIVLRSYPLFNHGSDIIAGGCTTVFENDEMLGLRFKSSSHLWISPRSTLVPGHLFDANEADLYLSFNHDAIAGEQTLYNYIRPANLYQVFTCPEIFLSKLRHYHPDIRLYHQVTPLIESIITEISSPDMNVAIYYYSCYLDIAVVRKNELLFYNTFHINVPEDTVYYLSGVSNMFDIDLSTTKIKYAGNFNQLPPEIAILKKYAGNIVDCDPPHAVTYSHYIQAPLVKNFINLFNLYGCGL